MRYVPIHSTRQLRASDESGKAGVGWVRGCSGLSELAPELMHPVQGFSGTGTSGLSLLGGGPSLEALFEAFLGLLDPLTHVVLSPKGGGSRRLHRGTEPFKELLGVRFRVGVRVRVRARIRPFEEVLGAPVGVLNCIVDLLVFLFDREESRHLLG